jgi:DNA-binding beta-propeller fold protein YncE
MAVFPHDAKGDVEPMRKLATPQATFAMAVDDVSQEIFMTVQQNSSVVVYRKTATGQEPALRKLMGDKTLLSDPHGIAVDPKTNLMFVNNGGATHSWDKDGNPLVGTGRFTPPNITVYPLKAREDTAPIRVIEGPKTQLNWAANMYLDLEHQELYVANDGADSILVFRETDSGDVVPVRVIKGPKTGIKNPTGIFVDAKNQELWVSNMGVHTATVYPRTANGNVAPLRTIRSAPLAKQAIMFENPTGVGYDSKRDQVLVTN